LKLSEAGQPDTPSLSERRRRHVLAAALALWAVGQPLRAYRLDFQLYNRADGLPDLQPTVGLQDRQGFIWIGTFGGGLARFDGRFLQAVPRHEFPGAMVTSMVEDPRTGALWIGSNAGLTRYDGSFRTWDRRHGLPNAYVTAIAVYRGRLIVGTEGGLAELAGDQLRPLEFPLRTARIDSLYTARDGTLWAVANLKRLFHFEQGHWSENTAREGVPDVQLYNVIESQGCLWLLSAAGVRRLEAGRWALPPELAELAAEYVRAPVVAPDGALWAALLTGVVAINGSRVRVLGPEQGLPNVFTRPLLYDRDGNLWISADGLGLLRLSARAPLRFDPFRGKQGPVWAIAQETDGSLWAASPDGVARLARTRATAELDALGIPARDEEPFEEIFAGEPIYSLLVRRDRSVWVGGRGWVARWQPTNLRRIPLEVRLGDLTPTLMREGPDGALWLAGPYGVGVLRGDDFEEIGFGGRSFAPRANAIIATQENVIWIAARTGFFRYRPGLDREAVPVLPELDGDMLQTMISGPDGSLWLGGYNGLLHYRPEREGRRAELRRIRADAGLSSDNVNALAFDNAGGLLVATAKGLDRLDLEKYSTGEAKIQRISDHRPSTWSGVYTNAALLDDQGHFWLGTTSGLARFRLPSSEALPQSLKTHLSSVRLFERRELWRWGTNQPPARQTRLELAPGEDHLSFRFHVPYFGPRHEIALSYRLEGLEESFTEPAAVDSATYPAVPPGTYRFQVRACADGSCRGEIEEIALHVAAPFWRRGWVLVASSGSSVAAISLWGWRRDRRRKQERRLLEAAVTSRTAELMEITRRLGALLRQARLEQARAELHPHFLFNALNGISALLEQDPRSARRMLVRLSNLLRLFLQSDDEHIVTLQEELFLAEQYLDLQQLRFQNRLRVRWIVEDACRNTPVPRLLLQPILENAIRYGIEPRREGGEVTIAAERADSLLRLRVLDDGPGFPPNLREGVGLSNLRSRLEALYGSSFSLAMGEWENGGGGCVEIDLPLVIGGPFEKRAGSSPVALVASGGGST
jgi:ligand-binding sensor domain-containing protein/signal transduction histidine kinase